MPCLLCFSLLGVLLYSASGNGSADELLRQVEARRSQSGEVEFVVNPHPDWDRLRVWFSGPRLRVDASLRGGGAPGRPACWRWLINRQTRRHEDSNSSDIYVAVRPVLVFEYDPRLFGLGATTFWRPESVVGALFSGTYPPDRVVDVRHKLGERESRDGRPCVWIESIWQPVETGCDVRIRRLIDLQRGPSVVIAESLVDGRLDMRQTCELKKFGETWFPGRVVLERVASNGALGEYAEIKVTSASFSHFSESVFSREARGIEPGFTILDYTEPDERRQAKCWTGDREVSFSEFVRLERAGLVRPGPKLRRLWDDQQRGSKEASEERARLAPLLPSGRLDAARMQLSWNPRWLLSHTVPLELWERYVDQVAVERDFNADRKRAAQGILKEMRGRAEAYRASRAEEYKKAQTLPDAKARDAELDRLERGVDDLFKELKDRVERL